jgi:hypothetical protein
LRQGLAMNSTLAPTSQFYCLSFPSARITVCTTVPGSQFLYYFYYIFAETFEHYRHCNTTQKVF